MKSKNGIFGLMVIVVGATTGCGKKKDTTDGVSGTAHILNGPTNTTALALNSSRTAFSSKPEVTMSTGSCPALTPHSTYYLTPDTMTATITSISFQSVNADGTNTSNGAQSGNALAGDCTFSFDHTKPSLSALTNCPMKVAPGTYNRVQIQVKNTIQFSITDSTSCIYTDSSNANLIGTAPPTGSATVSLDVSNCGNNCSADSVSTYGQILPSPVTVDADHPPVVYTVFDPTHYLSVRTGDSTTEFYGKPGASGTDIPIDSMAEAVGKVEFYTSVGSAGNTLVSDNDVGIRIYFSNATTPTKLNIRYGNFFLCSSRFFNNAWPGNPLVATSSNSGNNVGPVGWLGESSDKKISWVEAADNFGPMWTTLGAVFTMADVSATGIGAQTTLNYLCDASGIPSSTYPAGYQASGGPNYSVGAPTIPGASTKTLYLRAD